MNRIETLAMALTVAISSGLRSQDDAQTFQQPQQDLRIDHAMDATGVDITVENAAPDRILAILVSPTTGSLQLPASFGGGNLGLGTPLFVLALDETNDDYHLSIPLDTQAMAEAGITVFVQAISVDMPATDRAGSEEGKPVAARLSPVMTVDFGARVLPAAEVRPNPEIEGEQDDSSSCRCPEEQESTGEGEETKKD